MSRSRSSVSFPPPDTGSEMIEGEGGSHGTPAPGPVTRGAARRRSQEEVKEGSKFQPRAKRTRTNPRFKEDPGSETSKGEGGSHGYPARGPVTRFAIRHRSQEGPKDQLPAKRTRTNPSKPAFFEVSKGEAVEGTESMGSQGKIQKVQYGKTSGAAAGDTSSASPAAPSSTPSARLRFPLYPTSGKKKDLRKWQEECRDIRAILAADPDNDLPTRSGPKDPETACAVHNLADKMVVLNAARSIVSVSSARQDGFRGAQCTGIIIDKWEEPDDDSHQSFVIVTCSKIVCNEGKLLDPVPKGGNGGQLIDHDGNTRGMAFYLNPHPAVLSISTIITCTNLFKQFNCIARPMLDLGLRTVTFMDVEKQDIMSHTYGINHGLIVDTVPYDSDADKLGIRRGNVILSLGDRDVLTLPELEDYLLSLGWECLKRNESVSTIQLMVRVRDIREDLARSFFLPVTLG